MLPADALVTVSKPLAENLGTLHKGKPIYTILNGFDPEEVVKISEPITAKFTITYTGSIYKGKQNPSLLFAALQNLIKQDKIAPDDVEVRFYGDEKMRIWLEDQIKSYNLQKVAKFYGPVSRNEALQKQRESQLLLLLNWDDPRENGIYTGKVFEYLAAQRPILAMGGFGGVIKELLEETSAGVYAQSLENLNEVLSEWYSEYKLTGKVRYAGHEEKIQRYNHREMVSKFALVLENVSSK
jgi:glycosyltransferase involved in cell wall biosynthesis